jgi:hypothetical protein
VCPGAPQLILVSTGTEVALSIEVAKVRSDLVCRCMSVWWCDMAVKWVIPAGLHRIIIALICIEPDTI